MTGTLDKDSLNWLLRLSVVGSVLIGVYSVFQGVTFLVRALGNLSILGALLFMIDIKSDRVFMIPYRIVLGVWCMVLCHSAFGFVRMTDQAVQVLTTVTFAIYAFELLSVPLFTYAMTSLCAHLGATELERNWKRLTRFSAIYYIMPIVAFLAISVGRAIGAEIGLIYQVEDTATVPAAFLDALFRLLFFIPPTAVMVLLYRTRNHFARSPQPSSIPERP